MMDENYWFKRDREEADHLGLIGHGGFGEVHKFFARKIFRPFGIQVTPTDIENEVRAINKLCNGEHENIIKVYQHGVLRPNAAFYFIDMELCDLNLEEYIRSPATEIQGLLEWGKAIVHGDAAFLIWTILQQIVSGLVFVHSYGEVHRDLSPQNVLYSSRDGWWKIADFGLTSPGTTSRLISTVAGGGKPCYRAPELIWDPDSKHYNQKVDIWSLGCVLYELCTRAKGFNSDFACHDFARSNMSPTIPFSIWLSEPLRAVLRPMITDMFRVNIEERPSAQQLSLRLGDLSLLLQAQNGDHNSTPLSDYTGLNLTDTTNLLGSDVSLSHGVLRWEEIMPRGDFEVHMQMARRYERLVRTRKRLLGTEHPNTMWCMKRLAWMCFYMGAEEAEKMFKEVRANSLKVFGPEHQETLAIQVGLAWLYLNQGQNSESQRLFEDTLKMQQEFLHPEHADALASVQGLATLSCNQNDFGTAARRFEEVLQVQMQKFGVRCSDTLLSMSGLAWTCRQTHQAQKAIELYDQVIEAQTELLGLEHVDTLDSLSGRARAYSDLLMSQKAVNEMENVLRLQCRVLGNHHYLTWESMRALIREYKRVGNMEEMAKLKKIEVKARNSKTPSILTG